MIRFLFPETANSLLPSIIFPYENPVCVAVLRRESWLRDSREERSDLLRHAIYAHRDAELRRGNRR